MGSSKGNLIIQIFGRGVRLGGKGGDGKRRYIEQDPNYPYPLSRKRDRESEIRRLETLTVFSLKRSYLEHFLKEKNALNVYEDLRQNNQKYACYLNRAGLATFIQREAEKNQLQLYNKENCEPTLLDFLSLVGEIRYWRQGQDPITWTDQLNRQT